MTINIEQIEFWLANADAGSEIIVLEGINIEAAARRDATIGAIWQLLQRAQAAGRIILQQDHTNRYVAVMRLANGPAKPLNPATTALNPAVVDNWLKQAGEDDTLVISDGPAEGLTQVLDKLEKDERVYLERDDHMRYVATRVPTNCRCSPDNCCYPKCRDAVV
jgi:hypothetical protein